MLKRILSYVILLHAFLITASAQEIITGLRSNSVIINNKKVFNEIKDLSVPDTLGLPFFDDFSGHSIYPDNKKWIDNFVFINNTYSDKQITEGIATFDALDNSGTVSYTHLRAHE